MRILNICVFAAANENEPMISYLKKKWFWKFIQTGEHVNIFVFFIKTSCQSKESSLSKQSPL